VRTKSFPDLTSWRDKLQQHTASLVRGDDGGGTSAAQGLPRLHKWFQYHKCYVFHSYMKQWSRVLYIDAGMQIHNSLNHILEVDTEGRFIASSDGNNIAWQFTDALDPVLYAQLDAEYPLNNDAFMSTMFMFDTALISDKTFPAISHLFERFGPLARHNEQALLNLQWLDWQQLPAAQGGQPLYKFVPDPELSEQAEHFVMVKYASWEEFLSRHGGDGAGRISLIQEGAADAGLNAANATSSTTTISSSGGGASIVPLPPRAARLTASGLHVSNSESAEYEIYENAKRASVKPVTGQHILK